jgi:DNA (cytosine-5)-methyltransferase 1
VKRCNFIDLFAGCGGLSEGFHKSSFFHHLASVEWDAKACKTLINRLESKYSEKEASRKVIHFDIQRTKELFDGCSGDNEYGFFAGLSSLTDNQPVDLVVGGPPCQAYSLAGRIRDPNGMRDDYRNYLFESYVEVLKRLAPKTFIFENVPGILNAKPDGFNIINKISQSFEDAGFSIVSDIKGKALYNLSEVGVPQKRSRVILLGVNKSYDSTSSDSKQILHEFYENLEIKKEAQKTVEEAIGDLPKLYPFSSKQPNGSRKESHSCELQFQNHAPRFHNSRDIEIFKELTKDIESGRNELVSAESLKKLYTERTGRTSSVHKYYVLRRNEPSNLIPAHLHKDGLRHIHYDSVQARSITVREAARLQTFEDDFDFLGNMGDQYKMIGNAVPPHFSGKLAESIEILMKKRLIKV